nr:MAG TPA: hypothetical protein [Bacteriophage sp.]
MSHALSSSSPAEYKHTKTNYLFTPLTICVLNSYIFHFKYNYHFPDVLALHGSTLRRK